MLSLVVDSGLVGASIIAVVLPFMTDLSFDDREGRFLWMFCLSFILPVIAGGSRLIGGGSLDILLSVHGIFWPMLIASFFSFRYDKFHFFWSQVAIPASMIFPAIFLRQFIFDFGAMMAAVVLIQVIVYLMVYGNLLVRLIGVFIFTGGLLSMVFFFPLNLFTGVLPQVAIGGAYVLMLPGLWLLLVNPAERMELARSPDLTLVWYGILGFLVIVLVGLFWELINPIAVTIGLFAIMFLWLMRLDVDTGEGLSDFFTTMFLIASLSWLAFSLFDVTQTGVRVVIDFEFTLFRIALITAVNLVALKLVMDS